MHAPATTAAPVAMTLAGCGAAFAALAHGHAHGTEMPLEAAAATYAAGFVAASGALIGVGVAIACAAKERRIVPSAGAPIALAGLVLAAG